MDQSQVVPHFPWSIQIRCFAYTRGDIERHTKLRCTLKAGLSADGDTRGDTERYTGELRCILKASLSTVGECWRCG